MFVPAIIYVLPLRTRTGSRCQIRSQYSRIARSEEKYPQRAVLSIDMRVQFSGSDQARSIRRWHSLYAAKSASTKYRDIEGAFPRKKHFNYKNYAFDDYSDVTKKKATLFLSEFNKMSEMDMFKRLLKNKVRCLSQCR